MFSSKLEPSYLDFVIGLDAQPALRNLLITQSYHDLSSALARALGGEDVNWCTFATWASATAGTFIRDEEVPRVFQRFLSDAPSFRASVDRVGVSLLGIQLGGVLAPVELVSIAEHVIGDVRGQITAGNLAVYSELAPLFLELVSTIDGGNVDMKRADALLGKLRNGPSAKGGQSMLRDAFEQFMRAAREKRTRQRAEHMLLANALTGLHEQIRLQPYIAGSLDAPVGDVLGRIWSTHSETHHHPSMLDRLHALWDRFGSAVVHEAERVWNAFATEALMTLRVPEQLLHLGRTLPPPPGSALYPSPLVQVNNGEAVALMSQYDALDPHALGEVGATDWTALAQRMRYIIALFRSRQQTARLYEEPFDPHERAAMAESVARVANVRAA